jgi:hypothetical protein
MNRQDDLDLGPPEGESETPRERPLLFAAKLLVLTIGAGAIVGAGAALVALGLGQGSHDVVSAEAVATEPEPEAAVAVAPVPEPAALLLDAQARVDDLESQLALREQQLAEVAAAAGLGAEEVDSADLVAQVALIRANLEGARKYRDRLKQDLAGALARLEAATDDARAARQEAGRAQVQSARSEWRAFSELAKNELCDHGTRKGIDRCQRSVDAYFTDARYERYAECLQAGGATPVLLSAHRGSSVPATADAITGDSLPRREQWYVLYCDPDLPERADAGSEASRLATVE